MFVETFVFGIGSGFYLLVFVIVVVFGVVGGVFFFGVL
jgi:hypothetical protein